MQGIVLKMEPGAEYLVLRDKKVIQIWHPPGTSFCAWNEGNVTGREVLGRRGEGEVDICKRSNFPSVLPLKRTLQKCKEACLLVILCKSVGRSVVFYPF